MSINETSADVCYIIENTLGDYISSHDTLRWAIKESRRLASETGSRFVIIKRVETNFESEYTTINPSEWGD